MRLFFLFKNFYIIFYFFSNFKFVEMNAEINVNSEKLKIVTSFCEDTVVLCLTLNLLSDYVPIFTCMEIF